MAAERETVDRVIAAHLADQSAAAFAGRIAGVTRAGLFVKLSETGADGFVPAATLGDDYFRFEEANRAMVGARTRETFRLGGEVEVRLVEAAPFAGALRFEIVRAGSELQGVRNLRRSRAAQAELQGQASMNDMSRIWRIPTPPPDRSLREAMTRGFLGRCPACGRGRLFLLLSQRRQHLQGLRRRAQRSPRGRRPGLCDAFDRSPRGRRRHPAVG